MDLSILVISRSEENLQRLFRSLEADSTQVNFEVLCSWNGEDRPPIHLGKQHSFEVSFERDSYDYSRNNNQLAQRAKADLLLFANDDLELDAGSLTRAVGFFRESSNRLGILGANLRYANGLSQHAGIFIDEDHRPYHRLKGKVPADHPLLNRPLACPAVTGAFLMMRRGEFSAIGFDERCKVAGQDILLCVAYRKRFGKTVLYAPEVTAIHFENLTRRLFDQKTTPPEDMKLMRQASMDASIDPDLYDHLRLRVVTEKPGWIMHRKGQEIAKHLKQARINEDYPEANIHYYINYGRFRARPASGLVIANFTHYDPDLHAESWRNTAHAVDHCVAVSDEAVGHLINAEIPEEKISKIIVGADRGFRPRLTLGVVGRTYPGGRKGEALVQQLLNDPEVMNGVQVVSPNDCWGAKVWQFKEMADFYRSIDFLLVPALIEGGPVPFMEALACGTLSIAPAIGVVPSFPHVPYERGNYNSMKAAILSCREEHLARKRQLSSLMEPLDWEHWAACHLALFNRLLAEKHSDSSAKEKSPSG